MSSVKVKWADKGWARILARMTSGSVSQVSVGVVGSAASEPHEDTKLTVGEVALLQEFGNAHIPARPFVREAVVWGDHAGVKRIMAKVAKDMLLGTPERVALAEAGRWAVRKIQDTIKKRGVFVPNAPATVKRKGNDYTLRDSYQMVKSIGFEIVQGGLFGMLSGAFGEKDGDSGDDGGAE